jgi:hypothetical protein
VNVTSFLEEPSRVDEPQAAKGYADVLSLVVSGGKPMIVCRDGDDRAAVISIEHLELVREMLAQREVERVAAQIDWDRARRNSRPPQSVVRR